MKKINKLLDKASTLLKECEDIISGKAIINHKGDIVGYKSGKINTDQCYACATQRHHCDDLEKLDEENA